MIYIAIVSHGHEDLLIASELGGLLSAQHSNDILQVWIKDNKPSSQLQQYCQQHAVNYIDTQAGLGFGHNNNVLFQTIQERHGFQAEDVFVVMNPDVTITPSTIVELVRNMQTAQQKITTLNLYRDPAMLNYDSNIRFFPQVSSIFSLITTGSATQIFDKLSVESSQESSFKVEWASGAFLAFSPEHYRALGGFNQSYFMYFEDVDICYRSQTLLKEPVYYYPHLKAVHSAARKNRNVLSLHSKWFFQSFFKFLFHRYISSDKKITVL